MTWIQLDNTIVAGDYVGTWGDLPERDLPASAAVFCPTQLSAAVAVRSQVPRERELLVAASARAEEGLITALRELGLWVVDAPPEFADDNLRPLTERDADPGRLWLLTSGSTGRPKQVAHTLGSLTTVRGEQPPRTWLCPYTPGAYAWWQVVTLGLTHPGQTIVFVDSADLDNWPALAVEHGVTAASGTPTFWRQALVRSGETLAEVPLEQITLGGEPVDQGVIDALRAVFPDARISWIYASSEAGATIAVHDGLAGFPEAWLDRDAGDRPRLSIEGEELLIASKYRGEGVDEVLHTGDRVERRDGRVHIVGRLASDEINVGGSKASASAVREVLLSHPDVAWAAVRGRKAPIVGTMVTAEVVLEPGRSVTDAELSQYARRHLPEYAVPRRIRLLTEIPIKESLKSDV